MPAPNLAPLNHGWRALDRAELDKLIVTTFANGGTLRDLFCTLGALPDRLIQGSLFREALAQYALRDAFDELLQDPLILEALDVVWSGQQKGQTVVEFRFSQPHTLTKRTAFGAYKVEMSPTLHFVIDPDGDAHLYPGDVHVRWLLLKENLSIRLRRDKTATGATQDILHLSAGSVLSQTIPLAVLRIAPLPAVQPSPVTPVQSAPAPAPAAVAQEIKPAPVPEVVEVSIVLHQLPGRIRLRVASLYRNESQRLRLEKFLLIRTGIRRVSANVLTANRLVSFDPSLTAEEVEELVRLILRGDDPSALQQAHQDHAPWHLIDQAGLVQYWDSSPQQGLSAEAVVARRRNYGPNALPSAATRSGLEIFSEQLKSLPMVLLNASALLSLFTGGLADAVVILGVVFTNAYIGYATESRAERTISALTRGLRPTALAVREGREQSISGEQLVPGDLIILKRGMAVPADARLLFTERLTVDESALTGESVPVTKDATVQLTAETPLANRANMVYRGTVVTGGSAQALVVATGPATEVGQVQRMMAEAEQPETPLQRQLRLLSEQMVLLSLAICGGVFAIGLLRGRGVLLMLKTAVSLAVAAVPEGLPTVATTTLALGLRRLEQQHVLVRRLSAVETLGALQ
jgi:Ca2+-transporting ATPase